MYDKGKVILGLVIFFGLLFFPLWYTVAKGRANYAPDLRAELEKAAAIGSCVLKKGEMRANHMALLNTWRDDAVRRGVREYTAWDGRNVTMSLTNNCLQCHKSKKNFCDTCHDYLGVKPYCWNCHVIPEELEVSK
jgi:hypothetical protein